MDLTNLIMKISNPSSNINKIIIKLKKYNKYYIKQEIRILYFY